MRAGSAVTTDLDGLYAAQHLWMVRLAVLLLGDRHLAEGVVQQAFVDLARRHDRRRDPGAVVADLRARVVLGCRAAQRGRRPAGSSPRATPDTADDVLHLAQRQREVVVLQVWARLGTPQIAATVRLSERSVAAAGAAGLDALRRPGEPIEDTTTSDRVAEALERRADAVGADALRDRFADIVQADARRTARQRRGWLVAVALLIAIAVVAAVSLGAQHYAGPTPAPTLPPTSAPTTATSPLGSPALAPGERPRSQIPWSLVGPGWSFIVTATPATAVTTTVLLVNPDGTRYAVGSAPEGIVVQDASADARYLMVGVGSAAQEWDLLAGTTQDVAAPYGLKSLRYAGPDPSYGYLALWTDPTFAVRLQRWTADGNLRTEYRTTLASTAGSPRHPGVLVSPDGRTALLSSRDGPLQLLDFASDSIASPGPFDEAPSCEPLARWSRTEAVVGCGSTVQTNAYDSLVGRPFLVTPVGGTPTRAAVAWLTAGPDVVQLDDLCSTSFAFLLVDRRIAPITVTGAAAGLVPNHAVGRILFLGGTRCAADGDRFVAYDIATARSTELAGPEAGGRTVRQAVVIGDSQ